METPNVFGEMRYKVFVRYLRPRTVADKRILQILYSIQESSEKLFLAVTKCVDDARVRVIGKIGSHFGLN